MMADQQQILTAQAKYGAIDGDEENNEKTHKSSNNATFYVVSKHLLSPMGHYAWWFFLLHTRKAFLHLRSHCCLHCTSALV